MLGQGKGWRKTRGFLSPPINLNGRDKGGLVGEGRETEQKGRADERESLVVDRSVEGQVISREYKKEARQEKKGECVRKPVCFCNVCCFY